MTPEEAQKKAVAEAGVLLPDVDPSIGELVLSTLYSNENQHPAAIAAALARTAPDENLAAEIVSALFELLLCREKGHLYWINLRGHTLLAGARQVTGKEAIMFGTAAWPMSALVVGPPENVVIRVRSAEDFRRIWMACEPLDGVVVRQSEAVALGNAMIERFGGKIIEDRQGPETMQQSFIESNMTKRAKLRAGALQEIDDMIVRPDTSRRDHARVALAEASPGTLNPGNLMHPEDHPDKVYEVEKRVNESWVVLVAREAGSDSNAEPAAWLPVTPVEGLPEGYTGFTEESAIVRNHERPSPEV